MSVSLLFTCFTLRIPPLSLLVFYLLAVAFSARNACTGAHLLELPMPG